MSKEPTPHVDDLNNLRLYKLEASVVPPYVLDSIAKAPPEEVDLASIKPDHDIFLDSVGNNWNKFLDTIGSKTSNLDSHPKKLDFKNGLETHMENRQSQEYHKESLWSGGVDSSGTLTEGYNIPDLNSPWNGDARLRKVLNQDVYSKNELQKKWSLLSWFRPDKKYESSRHQMNSDFSPKIRSSAKYWMSTEQRTRWAPMLKSTALYNPFVLVSLRTIMFILSLVALGLAVSIFKNSKSSHTVKIPQQPSTIMAVVVQSLALVYLIYVTWDEYNGAPVGLRDPMGKIRLILLDLLFIIFSSANLSLAFNTLYDDGWVCVDGTEVLAKRGTERFVHMVTRALASAAEVKVSTICDKQRALSAFLFITLCMWVFTFTISIFRVVERVASPKS